MTVKQECPVMASAEETAARVRQEALARCPAFKGTTKKCPFADLQGAPGKLEDLLRHAEQEHSKAKDAVSARAALDAVLDMLEKKNKSANEGDHAPRPTMPEHATDVKLSAMLKEETRQVHREAENVAFIRAFIKCKLSKEDYTAFIVRMYHVYCALEDAFTEVCTAEFAVPYRDVLRTIWFPETLNRKARLEEDLAFFLGPDWRQNPAITTPSRAVLCYAGRLKQVAAQNPLLLVGHAYTRYLGDLSGGQTLRRMARKSLGLTGDEGTAFYVFPEIKSAKEFKNMYRARMDAMGLTEMEAKAVAKEAVLAFRLNIGLFRELDKVCGLAPPEIALPTAPAPSSASASPAAAPAKKCPFVDTPVKIAGPVGTAAHELLPRAAPDHIWTSASSLSALLKEETRQVHREAENVAFIRAFIKCKLNKQDYTAFVVRMYHVYCALEDAFASACNAEFAVPYRDVLRTIWFPETLNRKARLEEDLAFFLGPDWRQNPAITTPSRAVLCYVGRLKQVAAQNPLLLVGHAYTRYLGDLSGGQTLRRMARKSLGLTGDEGTAFYVFPEIKSAKEFKNMYRARMDAMGLTEMEAKAVAKEAVLAFRLNIGLFRELDELCGLVAPPETASATAPASGTCPFAATAKVLAPASTLISNSNSTTLGVLTVTSALLCAVAVYAKTVSAR